MPDRPQHEAPREGLDRRTFLAATAVGAVALSTPTLSAAATGVSPRVASAAPQGAAVRRPLEGTELGDGWVVAKVLGPEAGAVRVTVQQTPSARACHVLICRAEAGSGALASAAGRDFFLLNAGGDGARRTPDDEVAVVERLAKLSEVRSGGVPAARDLLTRAQRLRRYDPIDHADPLAPGSLP